MNRPIAVLRPEPGNAATATRIEALGRRAVRLPLFATHAIDWTPPDASGFDALILTSAQAPRLAGAGLAALASLPVHAVGAATAAAAEAAGLRVVATGDDDATSLVTAAQANGVRRALFLGGRDRRVQAGGIVAQAIAVYAADAVAVDIAALAGTVALLHSARAAQRLGALADDGPGRGGIATAAISSAVADAAGAGWARVAVSPLPTDDALIAAAIALPD